MSLLDFIVGNAQGMAVPQQAPATAVAPTPAPAARPQRRQPSALDMLFGVAAGYSPGTTRQRFNQRELEGAKAEAELGSLDRQAADRQFILSTLTDPQEQAVALANMAKWGENRASQYGVNNLARGAVLARGNGTIIAANPFTHMTGDEIVGVTPQGANRIYTRTAESIDEDIKRDRNEIDREKNITDAELTREGHAVERRGQDITQRGQDLNYDVALSERADRIDELNEPARAELAGYRSLGSRIDRMTLSALGDSGRGIAPEFQIGPLHAARYESELAIGRPSKEAAAYGLFRTNVSELVNESLRLNTGVQTEGDAKRTAESIMRNINNPTYVAERLAELKALNERAIKSREDAISRRESRTRRTPPPPQLSGSIPPPPRGFRIVR